ncbi:MAG TPA: aminoglycoside phosphotransferase family protein [Acidimicrobiales bacterium]|nr:aminoglycoside phosphotransferase family protein [Acidimicrobiales bacterium]
MEIEEKKDLGEPLGGGNMNTVRRDGATVVRNAGAWTPTVHRFLDFLHRAGLDWAPRPMGFDLDANEAPRHERLSYIEGEVPAYPLPDWVWADDVLCDGARRLRQLHDASVGFSPDGAVWQAPTKVPAEVVCHNDFSPHNLVFRQRRVVGVIDFDFCSPGPRIWDIAYFATRIVPLTASTSAGAPGMEQARYRVSLLLESYGDIGLTFEDVVRLAIVRLHDLAEFSRAKAQELHKPELLDDAANYDRDGCFLRDMASSRNV